MVNQQSDIWKDCISFPNLWIAYKKASRGKRCHASVAAFECQLEVKLLELQETLQSGAYNPGKYSSFYIHDPKVRLISAAPFCDRVVHHALVNVVEPLFEPKFIYDTYANRVGKGTHRALDRCTHYLRQFKYVLSLDVCQFFPSIDHQILLKILKKTVKDEQVLDLCSLILQSGEGVLTEEYTMVYFPGDDLLAACRGRGLPIGNLTSQFWANVYLNPLDHFIKRELKCRGYIRYVDDMLLFADDLLTLHNWREQVIRFLAGLRLTVHESSAQPRPTRCGIPFLGFQVFFDHRRVKRRKVVYARRRLQALARQYQTGVVAERDVHARVTAWINHVRYADSWGLRSAMLSQITFSHEKGGSNGI